MKMISAFFLPLLYTSVSADGVLIATNQQDALQSCQAKAALSPMELREEMLASCRCVVKKTDFQQARKLHAEKKRQALQTLYDEALKSCASQ